MEEVREMRRKISEEFGHDFSQLIAYYQELETKVKLDTLQHNLL